MSAEPFVLKKTVPLSVIALNMGEEILTAIRNGIARRPVYGLEEGDDLDEVVDHYLEHDGMADELNRLSRLRMEINLCCDISGSMYKNPLGQAQIVPAMSAMRMFLTAFEHVCSNLPPDVLRYNLWLWSASLFGSHAVCIRNPDMGTFIPSILKPFAGNSAAAMLTSDIDEMLWDLSINKPSYRGTGTALAPLLKSLRKWEDTFGETRVSRLDIVISDGQLYEQDIVDSGRAQMERLTYGKRMGVFLKLGDFVTNVPEGFAMYQAKPQHLDDVVREMLLTFIEKVV